MPTSSLFKFEVVVNGIPLEEYDPQLNDLEYPPCKDIPKSELDQVCYIQATPGIKFVVKVTYVGAETLSGDNAYRVSLNVDGQRVSRRSFRAGNKGISSLIVGKLVDINLEQPYIILI